MSDPDMRFRCLELAVKAHTIKPRDVIERAREFYAFVTNDAGQPDATASAPAGQLGETGGEGAKPKDGPAKATPRRTTRTTKQNRKE